MLALVGSLVTLLMSLDFMRREKIDQFEYPVLVLIATLGMMMLISAQNLIALYLGLELMSLALYVVAAFHRDNVRASEAGLKYFVLGALSSGMLLYGASLLYGFSGTISFQGIASAIHGQASIGVVFGLVFLMTGLAFKMSVVPFHMWTPDVYEGAPTPVTAFFAAAPKMAAVAVTVRVVMTAFPGITLQWQQLIVFISILSMALGSFAAIGQANIKRLMAYSVDRPYGFCARRPCRRHPARGARRAPLYDDLSRHDARHFRGDPFDARRRPLRRDDRRSRRPCARPTARWPSSLR